VEGVARQVLNELGVTERVVREAGHTPVTTRGE
jgi:hypothetical protein